MRWRMPLIILNNLIMITKSDVVEKLIEMECDIFMDGTCYGNDKISEEFGRMFIDAVNKKYNLSIAFDTQE